MSKEKYREIIQAILLHGDINHFDDNEELMKEYPDLKNLYVRFRLREDEVRSELRASLRAFGKKYNLD